MLNDSRWKALSARIAGFVDAVRVWGSFSDALANGSQGKQLYSFARSIFSTLEFEATQQNSFLPPNLLSSEAGRRLQEIVSVPHTNSSNLQGFVGEAAVLFHSILTEANYLLADNEVEVCSLAERAFLQLQWTIVADEQSRAKWKSAFKQGEVATERLGAAHLLWHGIYPFKVSNRVATDLILNEPLRSEDVGVARGAILTEWKVFRDGDDLAHKTVSAELQAEDYGSGVLGSTELRSMRYVVLVSEKKLPAIQDRMRGTSTYRHINIAVDPDTPSKGAPKQAATERKSTI